MRTKETLVYTFDELTDKAKQRARDWYRLGANDDNFWSECVIEDAQTIAEILGIDLKTRAVPLMSGKTKQEPCIYWSGFSSQYDGASFEGRYQYRKNTVRDIKAHAPQDTVLHRIAVGLTEIQKRYGYRAVLDIGQSSSGHYAHSYTMQFEDVGERELKQDDFDAMSGLLRKFADWIYNQLQEQYDYVNADAQVDESIMENGYEFDEEGRHI